jgi:hypothetical protein
VHYIAETDATVDSNRWPAVRRKAGQTAEGVREGGYFVGGAAMTGSGTLFDTAGIVFR